MPFLARFALVALLLAHWPSVAVAQPAEESPHAPADDASPADVLRALAQAYRQGPIVERVDIAWRSPSGAQVSDALWVGVDAPGAQAALVLGEARVWAAQRDERAIVRAAHVRDPVRIVSVESRASDLADALWSALPSAPAPQLALAFADDPAAADLWPGLRGARWRRAPMDNGDDGAAATLVGEGAGRRIELRASALTQEALALEFIVVSSSDGSRLTLTFTRLDAATTGAGAPLRSDPASWRLDVGPRRVVASLSRLAPLPPMQPPVLFSADGRPARYPAVLNNNEGVAAVILLDGDDAAAPQLAQLGERIRAALVAVGAEGDQLDARIAIATNAEAESLVARLAQWRDRLGQDPLWTTGGAGRLSQYVAGADVDALVLLTQGARTAPILALRAADATAAPEHAQELHDALQRIARDAIQRLRAADNQHDR